MRWRFAIALVWAAGGCGGDGGSDEGESTGTTGSEPLVCSPEVSTELFQQRIAPLLADDRPSSCNECHLSGIDLALYAQETPCQTMACMAEKGAVDLEDPAASVMLTWIERATPQSELITAEVIQAEYDAMLEWIEYSAACGDEVCGVIENPCGSPPTELDCDIPDGFDRDPRPFEDPGDCTDLTLEAAFRAKVYPWRGRCFPCHFDSYDGDPVEAPRWIRTGDCELGSLETMRTVVASGYINMQDPGQSLLLSKPLNELAGGVEHGGHSKFASVDEASYRDFELWIERYVQCNQ